MQLYKNNISPKHLQSFFYRKAQLVPEQAINTTVDIYENAIPYIKCQIRSTIQHEAAHRKDEETRNQSIIDNHQNPSVNKTVIPFDQFTSENRAEPIAEDAEENCDTFTPDISTGNVVSVNLNSLFNEANAEANIDESYKQSVKAGTLDPKAQGMYLMQNAGDVVAVKDNAKANCFDGFDGTLWVDVRKIAEPFMVNNKTAKPPTYQDDGMHPDVPNISKIPVNNAAPGTMPGIQSTPSIPSIPSIGAK